MTRRGLAAVVYLTFASVSLPLFVSSAGLGLSIQVPFSDISERSEFLTAISYMHDQGILQGYPDGTFRPKQPMNRVEFVKVIVANLVDQHEIDTCFQRSPVLFSDVLPYEWYGKFLCVAKERHIISGYPDGSFRPSNWISVVEAVKILAAGFGLSNGESTPQDPWYRPYLTALADKHDLPLSIHFLDSPVLRDELSEMIYRLKLNITTERSLMYADLSPDQEGSSSLSLSSPVSSAAVSSLVTLPISSSASSSPVQVSSLPFFALPSPSSVSSAFASQASSKSADFSTLVLVIGEECARTVKSLDPVSYRWFTDLNPNLFTERLVLLRFQKLCFLPQFMSVDSALTNAVADPSPQSCPVLTKFLLDRQSDPRTTSQNWIQMRYWSEAAVLAQNEWYRHGCSTNSSQTAVESRNMAMANYYNILESPDDPSYENALSEFKARF